MRSIKSRLKTSIVCMLVAIQLIAGTIITYASSNIPYMDLGDGYTMPVPSFSKEESGVFVLNDILHIPHYDYSGYVENAKVEILDNVCSQIKETIELSSSVGTSQQIKWTRFNIEPEQYIENLKLIGWAELNEVLEAVPADRLVKLDSTYCNSTFMNINEYIIEELVNKGYIEAAASEYEYATAIKFTKTEDAFALSSEPIDNYLGNKKTDGWFFDIANNNNRNSQQELGTFDYYKETNTTLFGEIMCVFYPVYPILETEKADSSIVKNVRGDQIKPGDFLEPGTLIHNTYDKEKDVVQGYVLYEAPQIKEVTAYAPEDVIFDFSEVDFNEDNSIILPFDETQIEEDAGDYIAFKDGLYANKMGRFSSEGNSISGYNKKWSSCEMYNINNMFTIYKVNYYKNQENPDDNELEVEYLLLMYPFSTSVFLEDISSELKNEAYNKDIFESGHSFLHPMLNTRFYKVDELSTNTSSGIYVYKADLGCYDIVCNITIKGEYISNGIGEQCDIKILKKDARLTTVEEIETELKYLLCSPLYAGNYWASPAPTAIYNKMYNFSDISGQNRALYQSTQGGAMGLTSNLLMTELSEDYYKEPVYVNDVLSFEEFKNRYESYLLPVGDIVQSNYVSFESNKNVHPLLNLYSRPIDGVLGDYSNITFIEIKQPPSNSEISSNAGVILSTFKGREGTYDDKAVYTDAIVPGSFTVMVPKKIVLDGATQSAEYNVSVTGDIAGNKKVVVAPEATVTFSQEGKDNVIVPIQQEKTAFTMEDISNMTLAEGYINAQGLSAGKWDGSFLFTITME